MKKIILAVVIVSAINLPGSAFSATDDGRSDAFPGYDIDLGKISNPASRGPASESDLTSTISDDIRGGYSSPRHETQDNEKSKISSDIESMIQEMKSTDRNIETLESQIMAANKREDTYTVRRLRSEIIKRRIERKGFAEDIRILRQRLNQLGG